MMADKDYSRTRLQLHEAMMRRTKLWQGERSYDKKNEARIKRMKLG